MVKNPNGEGELKKNLIIIIYFKKKKIKNQ